jgi:hypothetical protein
MQSHVLSPFFEAIALLLARLIYKKWVADKPSPIPPSQPTIINNIYVTPARWTPTPQVEPHQISGVSHAEKSTIDAKLRIDK